MILRCHLYIQTPNRPCAGWKWKETPRKTANSATGLFCSICSIYLLSLHQILQNYWGALKQESSLGVLLIDCTFVVFVLDCIGLGVGIISRVWGWDEEWSKRSSLGVCENETKNGPREVLLAKRSLASLELMGIRMAVRNDSRFPIPRWYCYRPITLRPT